MTLRNVTGRGWGKSIANKEKQKVVTNFGHSEHLGLDPKCYEEQ